MWQNGVRNQLLNKNAAVKYPQKMREDKRLFTFKFIFNFYFDFNVSLGAAAMTSVSISFEYPVNFDSILFRFDFNSFQVATDYNCQRSGCMHHRRQTFDVNLLMFEQHIFDVKQFVDD